MDSVCPRTLSVQEISSDAVPAGSATEKTPFWWPGRKCVGWPRSGGPGSMALPGPTGNVERFLAVQIDVAEAGAHDAGGVLVPAFVDRNHRLAPGVAQLAVDGRLLRAGVQQRPGRDDQAGRTGAQRHHHRSIGHRSAGDYRDPLPAASCASCAREPLSMLNIP